MGIKEFAIIFVIFIVFGCTKTAARHFETNTPEYSEAKENTNNVFLNGDKLLDDTSNSQKANKMLINYLEKQNKYNSFLVLIASDTGNFSDFTPLLEFKDLEILKINNSLITDINGIIVLSQLEKLSELILWSKNVTDISPLSALVNLRLLNINVDNTCTNASELLPLVNLESLTFIPISSETINNISKLTWLKFLYLGLNYEWLDISSVQNLKKLEKLTIRGPENKYIEFDISWISQLVNLQELKFDELKITDVSPLLKLPNIKKIDVMWCAISDENIVLLKTTGAEILTYKDIDH